MKIITITSVFPLDESGVKDTSKPARFMNTSHALAECFAQTMYKGGYVIEEQQFEIFGSFTEAIETLHGQAT